MKDAGAVGEAFGGFEELGGVEEGAAAPGGFAGFGTEDGETAGIHAGGEGFVEEPELGVDDEEGDEGGLVGLAAGQGAHGRLGEFEEIEGFQPVRDLFRGIGSIGLIQAEEQAEGMEQGFVREVGREIRQEKQAATQGEVIGTEWFAIVGDGAAVGTDKPGGHAEEGGLAGAIGTEDGHDLAGIEVEVDSVECAGTSVDLVNRVKSDLHGEASLGGWAGRAQGVGLRLGGVAAGGEGGSA